MPARGRSTLGEVWELEQLGEFADRLGGAVKRCGECRERLRA
jgi:hypothetical protein